MVAPWLTPNMRAAAEIRQAALRVCLSEFIWFEFKEVLFGLFKKHCWRVMTAASQAAIGIAHMLDYGANHLCAVLVRWMSPVCCVGLGHCRQQPRSRIRNTGKHHQLSSEG